MGQRAALRKSVGWDHPFSLVCQQNASKNPNFDLGVLKMGFILSWDDKFKNRKEGIIRHCIFATSLQVPIFC